MLRAQPSRLLVLVLVAFYALFGVAGARGLVLCIEQDGCFSIEMASAGDCEQRCAAEEHGAPGESVHASEGECGCLDVPLAVSGEHVRLAPVAHGAAIDVAALEAAGCAWPAVIAPARAPASDPAPWLVPRQNSARITSVVLVR